jgi:PLP dependent protein
MELEERTAEIRANLDAVLDRVEQSARIARRNASEINLVVVTKAQPLEVTRAAILAGAKILGENYPEEALPKMEALEEVKSAQWHMIGHLQSRKAKIVAERFDMLHSLDSIKLAEKMERHLAEKSRQMPVLLEVNVGEEETKYGWPAGNEEQWQEFAQVVEHIRQLPHLQIAGLMTMPPLYEDPELSRPYFKQMRSLQSFLKDQFPEEHFGELSMGTSADFEIAIEEGATYIRIGQAIVGPRPLKW